MPNQTQNPKNKKYDLEERTAIFGENTIKFVKTLQNNNINKPIISQLIRSATSVGANYCEADGAESKKDFQHKIALCKKEGKETKYWFRMLSVVNPEQKEKCRELWKETHELVLIFSKIINNSKKKK
ncbi:four helix bundle protein [bacterium]|nr:four helix bundle protein [bacterium]